jgi:phospholipase C
VLRSRRVRALGVVALAAAMALPGHRIGSVRAQSEPPTATPIKHLVVIFGENVSFDHYFGTYPNAANPAGEPSFSAAPNTPSVNGLSGPLLTMNPNLDAPFRLDRTQALTCDQDHNYTDEQKAYDGGLVDQFVQHAEGKPSNDTQYCPSDAAGNLDAVMGYYDGNTVTAMWNYAQNFALNDNSFNMQMGPSTPGAFSITAATTEGVLCGPQSAVYGGVPTCGDQNAPSATDATMAAPTNGTLGANTNDADPYWDVCSKQDASSLIAMSGQNIGDLLNQAGLTWGWFEGGFRPDASGKCSTKTAPALGDQAAGVDVTADKSATTDYIPHHEPFQYWASTANPMHLPPTSPQMVGQTDQANHQYDMQDFTAALNAGVLPAVTYLKAPAYQDGHAGYSDPLDEQQFDVTVINQLMQSKFWGSTAVVLAWDDSDGWYDHVMPPIVNQSATSVDAGCGAMSDGTPGRCSYGPRLPLLVISPYAKQNYVSNVLTDQSSIVKFIEDNWLGGQRTSATSMDNVAGSLMDMFDFNQKPTRALLLDPLTGEPAATH